MAQGWLSSSAQHTSLCSPGLRWFGLKSSLMGTHKSGCKAIAAAAAQPFASFPWYLFLNDTSVPYEKAQIRIPATRAA